MSAAFRASLACNAANIGAKMQDLPKFGKKKNEQPKYSGFISPDQSKSGIGFLPRRK